MVTVWTADEYQTLAEIVAPSEDSFESGVAKVTETVRNRHLRAKIVQVVVEMFNNILDHNMPPDGRIHVQRHAASGAIRVTARGKAFPAQLDRLRQRVQSIVDPHMSALPLKDREWRRYADSRSRGRGLYWIASGASFDREHPVLEVDLAETTDDPAPIGYSLSTLYRTEDFSPEP